MRSVGRAIFGSMMILLWMGTAAAARKSAPSDAEIRISPDQSVQIATMDMPQFGFSTRNAVELAIEQFGKLRGHPIQTKHYGKGCDARAEIDGFIQGLIREPKTVGLIGPICSGRTFRIFEDLGKANILTISPANTGSFLTDPTIHIPSYFRTSPNDFYQGIVGANFSLSQLQAQSAAIVQYGEDYSAFLAQHFSETFQAGGGEIAAIFEVPFLSEDFSAILDAMPAVDVVYAPVFEFDFATLANQLRDRFSTPLLGSDGAATDVLFELLEGDPEGIYLSNVGTIGAEYQTFHAAYFEEFGQEPGYYEPLAYDATRLLLRALDAMAEDDGKGGLRISPQRLIDYMNDSANYPFPGAGATYQAPVNGDLNPVGWSVFHVKGGEFLPFYP